MHEQVTGAKEPYKDSTPSHTQRVFEYSCSCICVTYLVRKYDMRESWTSSHVSCHTGVTWLHRESAFSDMAVYLWHTLCPSFISHICMSHVACHICVTGLVQKSPTKIGHVTYVWCHICVTWLMHKSPSEMGLFHREGVLTDQYVISASVSSRYHQLYQLSPLSFLSTSLSPTWSPAVLYRAAREAYHLDITNSISDFYRHLSYHLYHQLDTG